MLQMNQLMPKEYYICTIGQPNEYVLPGRRLNNHISMGTGQHWGPHALDGAMSWAQEVLSESHMLSTGIKRYSVHSASQIRYAHCCAPSASQYSSTPACASKAHGACVVFS